MRRLLALTLALLAAPAARAAVEVRVTGDTVDIQAINAPLSEILDGLSRQAKIKIVYQGPPPKQLLSVDIKGRTPAQALLAVLEGQGLAYAVALDRTGTRVETLLMAGGNNAPSPNAGPPAAMRPERPPMREPVVPEEPLEDPSLEEGEEGEAPPDSGRPIPPQGRPAEAPPAPAPGVFLPTPGGADYPTSVFAPRAPAPDPNKPKPEATPPPFNP